MEIKFSSSVVLLTVTVQLARKNLKTSFSSVFLALLQRSRFITPLQSSMRVSFIIGSVLPCPYPKVHGKFASSGKTNVRYHRFHFSLTIISINLLRNFLCRSDATRFRIAQFSFDDRIDSWAVDNVYMGPACPMHCRGHGTCRNGICM